MVWICLHCHICVSSWLYLHSWWWGVPPHQHANLLLIGQQGSHSFLVCGMTKVDQVHFQYPVPNTQSTLTSKAMRNHLLMREAIKNGTWNYPFKELFARYKGRLGILDVYLYYLSYNSMHPLFRAYKAEHVDEGSWRWSEHKIASDNNIHNS